jgi:flavin reductase (DIM6/NTAB) family NADH-FMN oxidoreductase RutF
MNKRKSVGSDHSMCVQPTFLIGTYDENGNANFTPITWLSVTGLADRCLLVISMFGTKKTKQNVARTGKFSANLVSTDMLELVDYFGSRSSHKGVKNEIPYEYSKGEVLDVPTLDMSRWVYECEVSKVFQTGDSDTYFCEIRNVTIDETII